MKKRILALLLCVAMTALLLTGCSSSNNNAADPTPTQAPADPTPTEVPQEPVNEEVTPEALPEAFAHLTFDEGVDEGYKTVIQVEDVGANDGATYGIADANVTPGYGPGAVGTAVYLDGAYGIDLGLQPTNTDSYSVSFWMNATRLSTYGPTLQMGYSMGKAADVGNDVTWLNVTQSEWGESSAKIFPIVWSRNEASDSADGTVDCWPWMYAFDNEIHGKKEWVMVTIVCSGEAQAGPTGATTVGAQYYINGALVYDSQANYTSNSYFEYTWDASLAPNIMKPGDKEFESLFGINYWDTVFKGFVDDLYIFDTALTPGQVATLYGYGDPTVEVVEPATAEPEPEEPVITLPDITADANAIDTVCAITRDSGFWTDWSESFELADGATRTVVFNNYSNAANNWSNYVVAFTNAQTAAHIAPAEQSADYAEYAVVRADAYGWVDGASFEFNSSWGDDWAAFVELMKDAEVKLEVSRTGGEINVNTTFTAADGTQYTQTAKITSALTADAPCYFFLTGEGCYLEILSVE